VVVVETKADGDVGPVNVGKAEAAGAYFASVNDFLKKQGNDRRYRFHFLSPEDYEKFFEALREGQLDGFRSTLHANLLP
jgi:type III restriction enzyme